MLQMLVHLMRFGLLSWGDLMFGAYIQDCSVYHSHFWLIKGFDISLSIDKTDIKNHF